MMTLAFMLIALTFIPLYNLLYDLYKLFKQNHKHKWIITIGCLIIIALSYTLVAYTGLHTGWIKL